MQKRLLYIVVIALITMGLYAQEDVREKELSIKSSGDYFYAQYTGENAEEAQKMSLEGLIYTIAENHEIDINVLKVKVTGIEYLTWPVGPKIKTLAFVRKDAVNNLLTDKKPLQVVPIEYSEKQETDKIVPAKNTAPEKTAAQKSPNNENDIAVNESDNFYPVQQTEKSSSVIAEDGSLVSQIQSVQSIESLLRWLAIQKNDGLLVYGRKDDFPTSYKKCYVAVISPEKDMINAILSPEDPVRKDIKSNKKIESIEKEYINMSAIWIQIF